jgi:hypothetical protein
MTDQNAATGLLTPPNGGGTDSTPPPRTHVVEPPPKYSGLFSASQNECFNWENKSGYHKVEIWFVGGTPLTQNRISVGNGETVPATVIGDEGAYLYTVHYRTEDGKKCKNRGPFVMHVDSLCRGCIP